MGQMSFWSRVPLPLVMAGSFGSSADAKPFALHARALRAHISPIAAVFARSCCSALPPVKATSSQWAADARHRSSWHRRGRGSRGGLRGVLRTSVQVGLGQGSSASVRKAPHLEWKMSLRVALLLPAVLPMLLRMVLTWLSMGALTHFGRGDQHTWHSLCGCRSISAAPGQRLGRGRSS